MAQRNDKITLDEIAENIANVREFIGAIDYDAFRADKKTRYAVVRALEVISEAARRLSPELKGRHPSIPWRQVEDAGNAYRHAYHNLQEAVLWATSHEPLDELSAVVEAELSRPADP